MAASARLACHPRTSRSTVIRAASPLYDPSNERSTSLSLTRCVTTSTRDSRNEEFGDEVWVAQS